MSLAADVGGADTATCVRVPIVLTDKGAVLPGAGLADDRRCGLGELLVLERLVASDGEDSESVARDVAARTGDDVDELVAFATSVALRPDLARGVDDGVTVAPDDVASPSFSDERLVLPTPLMLGMGSHGFYSCDDLGRVRLTLAAVELAAIASFVTPITVDDAFAQHTGQAHSFALDRTAFEALVARLLTAEILRPFDTADLAFRRGYNRAAENYRREVFGRRAVGAAIKQEMSKLDAAESERRSRVGTGRTKVFPVHAISSAWRNPPLSLGLILAYVRAYEGGALLEHFDVRPDWMLDDEKVQRYSDEPSVYLFSNYVWSSQPNLTLSAQVKAANPGNVTMHGGPDVPKYPGDVEAYFAANPHVDITARGEGEITTAEVLSALAGTLGDGPVDLSVLASVPGICYRDGDRVVSTPDRERLSDLDAIPSPYLDGLFDVYAEGWQELDLGGSGTDAWAYQLPVAVLETNRGCPYGCTFCDWGSATLSRIRQFDIERIYAELEWCAKHRVDTVGLADANFGIFKRDVDITAKVAELKTSQGFPKQFGTNYAKNTVKHLKQIVETLAEADILSYGLLSLQSMDASTLETIDRSNIKLEKYEALAREFQRANLPLYVDLMVGLPGQTVRSFGNDLQECIDREVHAKVFPTQLLVNSPMNSPDYRARHGITAKPGQLVLESGSFTRDEYDRMMRMRSIFFVLEKFGVLRHPARYVRQESGIREIDLFDELYEASHAEPDRWPIMNFALNGLERYMVPPVSWPAFLAEVRSYLVETAGVPDDSSLDTVFRVQQALLPARGRVFPAHIELEHDYAAWHAAMLDAKYDGHLADWPAHAPRLNEFGPATFTVSDPRNVCLYEMGRPAESNPWDAWDLESPVSRPVMLHS